MAVRPKTARRKREIDHTRHDILRAAARAFAQRGLEGATVHDIAREAGYTAASLYTYFDGKQQIIDALFRRVAAEILGAFDEAASPGQSFGEALTSLLRRQLERGEQWQEVFALFFIQKAEGRVPKRPGLISDSDLYLRRLTVWIGKHADRRDLGGRPPEEVAIVLKSLLLAVYQQWLRAGRRQALSARAEWIVDILMHGLPGEPPRPK